MASLTSRTVESAKPQEKEYLLADGSGLYLRVLPSGGKSWVYKYRRPLDGKQAKVLIGNVNDYSLKVARQKAREYRMLLDDGKDPNAIRAAELKRNSSAQNMQALFESWMAHCEASGKTALWLKRYRERWNRYLKKALGNILATDLHRAHLAGALDVMTSKGIKEETRKALSLLNLMLDYGVQRHYLDINPARLLKPKDFAASAGAPRDRALLLPELRSLWLALDAGELSMLTAAAIRLLMLTGARRGEVVGMKWKELDLEAGMWVLPKSRTKNGRGHTIHLSVMAVKIIKSLQPITGQSRFVFESTDKAGQPIHQDSLTKALMRLRQDVEGPLAKVPAFTLHDLRRSASTGWGEHLKVPPHIIELMLNHLPKDKLVATYQRASYAEEQRAAWIAWGQLVERFVVQNPENVVSMRSRKSSKKRG